jgi:L-fuconolactonase
VSTSVDAHGHFWKAKAGAEVVSGGELSPASFVQLLDTSGVDVLIQVSRYAAGYDHEESFVGAEQFPGRFWVLTRIAPNLGPEGLGAVHGFIRRRFFAGVRLYERDSTDWLSGEEIFRLLEGLESLDVTVAVYAPGQEEALGRLAERSPGLRIVIDHAGAPIFSSTPAADRLSRWAEVMKLHRHRNVYLKLSGLPEATAEAPPYVAATALALEAISLWGAERVLWGSNYPPSRAVGTYGDMVQFVERVGAQLSPSDWKELQGGTAGRLFAPRGRL